MKNVLSLEAFLDFVEKKDPTEGYRWTDATICACGQYADFLGISNWNNRSSLFWNEANRIARPIGLEDFLSSTWNDTWGNLASRLKERVELEKA